MGSAPSQSVKYDASNKNNAEERAHSSVLDRIRRLIDDGRFDALLSSMEPVDLAEYISNHAPHISSDEEKIHKVFNKLSTVPFTPENQSLFGRPAFRESILSLIPGVSHDNVVFAVATGLEVVTRSEGNTRNYSYRPLRNAIVHLGWEAKSPESVCSVCELIVRFCEGGTNAELFGTPAVRDCLITMATRESITPQAVASIGAAVVHLCATSLHDSVFATNEFRNAIVSLCSRAKHSVAVVGVCGAISALAMTSTGKTLLGTSTVASELHNVVRFIEHPEAVVAWTQSLLTLCSTDENKVHFCTTALLEDILMLGCKHATSAESIENIGKLIASLAMKSQNERRILSAHIVIDDGDLQTSANLIHCLCSMSSIVERFGRSDDMSESAKWICNAIANLCSTDENRRWFSVIEIRDVFVEVSSACKGSKSAMRAFTRALQKVATVSSENLHIYGGRSFKRMLLEFAEIVYDVDSASDLIAVLAHITNDPDNRIVFGNTELISHSLSSLSELIKHPIAAFHWWVALRNLCGIASSRIRLANSREIKGAILSVIRATSNNSSIVAMGKSLDSLWNDSGKSEPHGQSRTVEFADVGDVRSAIFSVATHATSSDAVGWISRTMFALARFSPSHFCDSEFLTNVTLWAKHAHNSEAIRWICRLVNTVALQSTFRPLLAGASRLRKNLVDVRHFATSPDAVQQLSYTFSLMDKLNEDENFV